MTTQKTVSAQHTPGPDETKDAKAPSSIRNHPAVRYVVRGEVEGSDYRWFVELRDGWRFTAGAKEACTGGGFNTVEDFRYANAKATGGASHG